MRKNLLLLASCQALMVTNMVILGTSSALIGQSLAANKALATLPVTLLYVATLSVTIPASMFMGKFGRQAGFLLGSSLGLLGAAAASLALYYGSFPLFCLATTLIGCFSGFGNYYRFAAVEGVPEASRSNAISLVMAGGVVAAVAGPNIARYTRDWISDTPFVGTMLVTIGIYATISLLLLFIDSSAQVDDSAEETARSMREVARGRQFRVAVLSGMLGYAVMVLVMTATPLAMKHDHHSFSDTAFVIQWHVLGMFAPSFITGRLIRRFGVFDVMLAGCVFLALSVGINLSGTSVNVFWLGLTALGVGWNFVFIGATSLLTTSYRPSEKSKAQAANDFVVFTMVAIASLAAGALQDRFGWQAVNLSVIPMIAVVAIALLVQRRAQ